LLMGVGEILIAVGSSSVLSALVAGVATAYSKNKDADTATQQMLMAYASEASQDRKDLRATSAELIELGFAKERSEHYSRRYMAKAQPAVGIWGPAPELPLELEGIFGDVVPKEERE